MGDSEQPEFNISRLMRDTAANMTWEGTTNVLSSEVVRHLLNKNGRHLTVFGEWVQQATSRIKDAELKNALDRAWTEFFRTMDSRRDDMVRALARGRQLMFSLARITSGVLLTVDVERDGNAVATEIAPLGPRE